VKTRNNPKTKQKLKPLEAVNEGCTKKDNLPAAAAPTRVREGRSQKRSLEHGRPRKTDEEFSN